MSYKEMTIEEKVSAGRKFSNAKKRLLRGSLLNTYKTQSF